MSRAPKLNAELQARIVAMIAAGIYPETAARACGVGARTYYEWMARAAGKHPSRKPTPAMIAFAKAVDEAVAKAEVFLHGTLVEYVRGTRPSRRNPEQRVKSRRTFGQVATAEWLLSRRFPERWAQRPAAALAITAGAGEGDEANQRPTINIILAPEPDESGETTLKLAQDAAAPVEAGGHLRVRSRLARVTERARPDLPRARGAPTRRIPGRRAATSRSAGRAGTTSRGARRHPAGSSRPSRDASRAASSSRSPRSTGGPPRRASPAPPGARSRTAPGSLPREASWTAPRTGSSPRAGERGPARANGPACGSRRARARTPPTSPLHRARTLPLLERDRHRL